MSTSQIDPQFLISDELWEKLQPLLPPAVPKPRGGRPRMEDRKALDAIVYVMRTGIQWKALPRSLGASSTVHDRFQEWVEQGVMMRFWQAGLAEYAKQVEIDWEWQTMDGGMVKAPLGGDATGRNPTDRGKSGTKRSVQTDGRGIPLSVVIDGANRHDMKLVEATLENQQMVPADRGKEEKRNMCMDKGYDYEETRQIIKDWGFTAHIPPKDEKELIIHDIPNYRARRWVVERTHSWFNRFRRLLIRWEKKGKNYLGMLHFACAVIAFRAVDTFAEAA
jgi:putative transposase